MGSLSLKNYPFADVTEANRFFLMFFKKIEENVPVFQNSQKKMKFHKSAEELNRRCN